MHIHFATMRGCYENDPRNTRKTQKNKKNLRNLWFHLFQFRENK